MPKTAPSPRRHGQAQRWLLLPVLVLTLAMVACSPVVLGLQGDDPEAALPVDLVEVRLEAPDSMPHSQPGGLVLSVHNPHPDSHLLLSEALYEFRVLQDDGTEIWSHPRAGRTGGYFTIAPGDTQEITTAWPQPGHIQDGLAPPGRYEVQATFKTTFAQVLQDGETLATASGGTVEADPQWITVTEEQGDPEARPFPPITLLPPEERIPRTGGGTRATEQVDLGRTARLWMLVGAGQESIDLPLREPLYDFIVTTLDGKEVWRWRDSQNTNGPPVTRRLEPGEWWEPEAEWDLRDHDGEPVPPGMYLVHGRLLAEPGREDYRKVPALIVVGPARGLHKLVDVSLDVQPEVEAGGPLTLRLVMENVSGHSVRLGYGADNVTFTVYDESGEEIWPGAQFFRAWGAEADLLPGELRWFERTWPLTDKNGEPVPPGTYTMVGHFKATMGGLQAGGETVSTEPFKVEVRP